MRYVLIQDLNDPAYQVYGLMTEDFGELLGAVEMDCTPCQLPVEHIVVDRFPPQPPCIRQ